MILYVEEFSVYLFFVTPCLTSNMIPLPFMMHTSKFELDGGKAYVFTNTHIRRCMGGLVFMIIHLRLMMF